MNNLQKRQQQSNAVVPAPTKEQRKVKNADRRIVVIDRNDNSITIYEARRLSTVCLKSGRAGKLKAFYESCGVPVMEVRKT